MYRCTGMHTLHLFLRHLILIVFAKVFLDSEYFGDTRVLALIYLNDIITKVTILHILL